LPVLPTIPARKSFAVNTDLPWYFHGMEEVVGSIPTRSTIFSTTYRYCPFRFGSKFSRKFFDQPSDEFGFDRNSALNAFTVARTL
jgi:hypothetical protein